MERRTSAEVIQEILPLHEANVMDVGCGDGWLARLMTRKGGHVTGVEVSPKHLAHARAIPAVGDEHYIQGLAEDLPASSRSLDVVVFFNSFHHVDKSGLLTALKEAARVLKQGGLLLVIEPLAEGPYFELMKPVHDETAVRRQAQNALIHAPDVGLLLEQTFIYEDIVVLADFKAFHDRLTMINPHVREEFEEKEDELRAEFDRLGSQGPDGWSFRQPMRLHLFRRS